MNRRLFWSALAAVAVVAAAVPLLALAQNRPSQGQPGAQQGALAEHKAQEQRERDEAAERAKRREAARTGQDSRAKARPQKEEEEEERGRR
ncbi:hypothetical protein B1992_09605 [Pseudoxanthomonas broegbernensis]|uniref:Uncharacterized protein n=1 Tax=Pseudoxanthomonas broegbernensis TaxID=83619 RepID=A0A7V8K6R3_9GAMM|nr:hypothetical protein [Pseudoxanthomonas broegbernensis]KAF1686199.1 hypothetical protein B1992_09605 [Pseudoxanthomonas broegbernensis]MBB6063883.1 hypothetical protein [Pseudoxanthomonas broegbernensis]